MKYYETMGELKEGIRYYFNYYNSVHLHQGLDYEVPDDMYQSFRSEKPDRNMVLKYTLNKLFFCIDKMAQYNSSYGINGDKMCLEWNNDITRIIRKNVTSP